MVTIVDIAEALGISAATVSRALNNSRLVSPELTESVKAKGAELGYKKRLIRRHRGRAILSIKLILPHHEEPERALFYDLASLIENIRLGFRECAINLLCETASSKFKPYPHKKGGDTSGFIFAFNQPGPATLRELREVGTPFVVINRQIPGIPCVASENAQGMADIAAHLLERKSDLKPAYFALEGMGQVGEERFDGFTAACASLGIDFDPQKDAFRFDGIFSITAERVRDISGSYNAIVCANDIVGTVVLTELDRLGIAIPSRVAVTGFDDSPVRRLSRPLITTVSMPIGELARSAASRLETQIIERKHSVETIRIPGTLLAGEST
jgi:LacI family transcriptional regulator